MADRRTARSVWVPCSLCDSKGCPACERERAQRQIQLNREDEARECLKEMHRMAKPGDPVAEPRFEMVQLAAWVLQWERDRRNRETMAEHMADTVHWADFIEFHEKEV